VAWLYDDREDAGRTLAALVADAALPPRTLVIAVLRGGLPVAQPIALSLGARLGAFEVHAADAPRVIVVGLDPAEVSGRPVLLVDDGMMTGSTMRVAVHRAIELGASSVVIAAPVASAWAIDRVSSLADLVICPAIPEPMHEVRTWYRAYEPVEDDALEPLHRPHAEGDDAHMERR
jgi:predicted phosphoribosyltransferase